MRARFLSKIASHHETQSNTQSGGFLMDKNETAPRVETTYKLGNTTYVVNGFYASKGATATEKIKRLLDRETKK